MSIYADRGDIRLVSSFLSLLPPPPLPAYPLYYPILFLSLSASLYYFSLLISFFSSYLDKRLCGVPCTQTVRIPVRIGTISKGRRRRRQRQTEYVAVSMPYLIDGDIKEGKEGRSQGRQEGRKERRKKGGKKGGRKENGSRDWQIICLCRQASTNNSIERSTLRLLHCCCTHLSGHFELFCLPWYPRLWGMTRTVRHTLFVSASSSFSPYLLFQF